MNAEEFADLVAKALEARIVAVSVMMTAIEKLDLDAPDAAWAVVPADLRTFWEDVEDPDNQAKPGSRAMRAQDLIPVLEQYEQAAAAAAFRSPEALALRNMYTAKLALVRHLGPKGSPAQKAKTLVQNLAAGKLAQVDAVLLVELLLEATGISLAYRIAAHAASEAEHKVLRVVRPDDDRRTVLVFPVPGIPLPLPVPLPTRVAAAMGVGKPVNVLRVFPQRLVERQYRTIQTRVPPPRGRRKKGGPKRR